MLAPSVPKLNNLENMLCREYAAQRTCYMGYMSRLRKWSLRQGFGNSPRHVPKLQNTKNKTLGIFQRQTGPPQMGGNRFTSTFSRALTPRSKTVDTGRRQSASCGHFLRIIVEDVVQKANK